MNCFIRACDWISSVFIIYVGKQKQALINVLKCRMAFLYSPVNRIRYLTVPTGALACSETAAFPISQTRSKWPTACVLLCNIGPSLRRSATLWRSHSLQRTVTSAMSSVPCRCPPASTRRSITLTQNHFDMLSLRVNRQIL